MFIICFVFAVIGYHYFGNINIRYASYLNDQLNFSSFTNSLITVFIFCTGEGWPFALADCSGKTIHHSCNSSVENCGSPWAIIYFIALQVIFNWILLNSFIAITVDTFVTVLEEHDEIVRLEKVWNAFNQQWIKYDWNKSGDLTFVELVNMYNSFKLPKGTEWGNQNRENGLLVVKPPMEEIFKNVKVYKNRCKYHDVIFGFLNSWMGEELPESFLIREKEKVKTGYEKKVFEKRKNSIYSLDNSITEEKKNKTKKERLWEKSKTMYGKVAKALSLRSSKRESPEVNIHILVENTDPQGDEDLYENEDTLNSGSLLSLSDDYIKMNMHTAGGRLQHVYTQNLLNLLHENLPGNASPADTPTTATPTTATPTTGTTIFNLFEASKNDLSSDTLNELSRSSDDKGKEKEKEDDGFKRPKSPFPTQDPSLTSNTKIKSDPELKKNGILNEAFFRQPSTSTTKSKGKDPLRRESMPRPLPRHSTTLTLNSQGQGQNPNLLRTDSIASLNLNPPNPNRMSLPTENVFRRPDDKPKASRERDPVSREGSQRQLKRTSTTFTLGSQGQNPNLLRTDSIPSLNLNPPNPNRMSLPTDNVFRRPDDKPKASREREPVSREGSQRQLKRTSTTFTLGSQGQGQGPGQSQGQNPNLLRTESQVNLTHDHVFRRPEGKPKYREPVGPVGRETSARHLKRHSTNVTLGSQNQNPNLLRTDSFTHLNNEAFFRRQEEEDKYRNRGPLRGDTPYPKLKRNSTNHTLNNPNDPFFYRPVTMNPISSMNPKNSNIMYHRMTYEPSCYESSNESQYQASLPSEVRSPPSSSEERVKGRLPSKLTDSHLGIYPVEEEKPVPYPDAPSTEETANVPSLKRHLRNPRYQTLSDLRKPERLSLSRIGRSRSFDNTMDIYQSPAEDSIHQSIIELDAMMGVEDEPEDKKNKHRSIHIKNNLHRIKSRTSFRMGFKDNYLDNDILIDVNNQGLPFHVVYAIYQLQRKFKQSRKERQNAFENTGSLKASPKESQKNKEVHRN